MRKILFRLAVYLVLMMLIPSCEDDENCKDCVQVIDDCGTVSRGTAIRTCGELLDERESEYYEVGCKVTYWECN